MSALFYDGVDHMIEKITTLIKGKANNSHKHTKNDITDFPTLGTASSKDVASSGNASATQVVMGNDTRLSDARKASDVSAWAKASSKPGYTKSEIGLGNVDNTSDSSKPVSTAQQDAINAAYANANKYTDKKVADLIGSAPETMDTLEEVAAAIQENKDVETALNEAIGKKANQTELDTHTGNSTIHIIASERTNWNAAKTHADSAHARTDATKVEKSSTNGNIKINGTETIVYTHPGSGTNPHGTTKSDVGLGNVDNTADANKSVKYAASAGSADILKVAASITGGDGDTAGYRLIASLHINARSNHRSVFLVHSSDIEAGILAISISCDNDTVSQANVSAEIKYFGTVGFAPKEIDIIYDSFQIYISPDGETAYLFARHQDFSLISITLLRGDFTVTNGAWMTSIDTSKYGVLKAKTEVNSAQVVNGHTVESDVPSNAKFTDTDTWRPQPDWNATSGDAAIKNKPTIPDEVMVDAALSSKSTNPLQNKVVTTELDKKADKTKYGDTIVSVGRKPDSTIGDKSFAFGDDTTASGAISHAEGYITTARGNFSHAEGQDTVAGADGSHAEGGSTTASEAYSHAEGHQNTASAYGSHVEGALNTASGDNSHAEGNSTTASGYVSHAEGYSTKALDNQHAQGHFNNTTTATDNSVRGTSTGTAFVIGNGTDDSSLSNAFRVTGDGYVYATNAAVQTGADYAEYFEWSDGNPDNEDRVGLFVTFDENNQEKIRIANSNDDYILGIVSGMPSVIGNGDEDWKKRYVLDDFGRYIQETFEYVIDGETKTGTKWKENPEYDSTKTYASRNERAEWSAIGLVGILSVYDDGTCQVNGYCKCKNNGIATASEKGADTYRVIKRVTDNIVKVVLK